MEIEWLQCKGLIWCELNKLDLEHRYLHGTKGIYIIWYEMNEKVVVKTGKGDIRDELLSMRKELAIQAFSKYNLKVTWAEISKSNIQGAFNYITQILKPKIESDETDSSRHIEVNLPW